MKSLTKIFLPILTVFMLLYTPPAMPVCAAGPSTEVTIQMVAPANQEQPEEPQPSYATGIASNPSLWTGLAVASAGLVLLGLFFLKQSKDEKKETDDLKK